MTETQILDVFKKSEALLTGHFLLTSGRHSDKYFQCAKILQYPDHTEKLCTMIVDRFKDAEIDTVISPAIGGLVVGQEVSRQLNKRFVFAEREDGKLTLRRGFSLDKNEKVLVCEDVVTTGGSVFEVIDIVKNNNADVAGIGFIVDRSNGKVNFGFPQFSALKMNVASYPPQECPLCNSGSKPIKPGSRKL
ncbi:MAG: orotate phosphoribosyltransferase [Ignavibacteriaceae bacterium]|nr:orotate phosphoribosyltransferase [Ignavibacteriaceae bacterium]